MVQDKKLPLIGVMNCTGQQGASVLLALFECGRYRLRGLTKNPKSDAMMELCRTMEKKDAARKLEGDDICLFDEEKEDTYEKSFRDLDMLFAMTNPTPQDPELELKRGRMIADYAKKCNLKLILWSGLPNVEALTKGSLKVPQFTMKARVEDYMREIKLPYISLMPGFFLSNLESSPMFRLLKRENEWILRLPLKPDTRLPVLDPSREMGAAVLYLIERRDDFLHKAVPIYGDELTMSELVKSIDPRVRYELIDREALRKLPMDKRDPPLDNDSLDMFRYFDEFGYYGKQEAIVNLRKQLKMEHMSARDYFKTRELLKA